ncbi:MAG: BMP family ABC transporter substrate-binding protein [Acidimicrobiia bacterium]|nr:BMP family ABC transporter substrate-binding protein [Acidimicrobiia bacterium]MDH5519179.1 BMP family ABC transporter substrate-binding protein [Acidimicrobiia bacterium]
MIRTTKWLLAIATSLVFILAACGGSDSDSDTAANDGGSADGDGIRVAIVAPSAENDLAFTQSIIEGVDALSGVSDVAVTPGTFVVEDAATAIRNYAEDGYDLILAHGSQYGGPLQEIAAEYPDTAFAWGTAEDTFGLDNVSSYTAASDQGGYVLGALAASMCSKIGVVGPIEVGDAKLYVDGFKLGAEAGGAEVDVVYTESFSDVQLAADTASAFVQNGADCLTGTAQMTVGAIGVAEQEGLLWFGTQSDQTPAAADGVVVANQIYEWEIVLQGLVDDVANGSLGGNIYGIDLENGGLVVDFGNVEVTDEMTQLVSDVSAQVIAKEVTTTVDG